jgi:Resolvase, N terminal domain
LGSKCVRKNPAEAAVRKCNEFNARPPVSCVVGSFRRFSMGEAMKRAAIYLRVSTQDQTTSDQEHELRQAAERAGWQVAKVYEDHGISGAKGRNGRPAFDALCRDATKRSAIQLTHIGMDQSPMMTVHSMKIRARLEQRHHGEDQPQPQEKTLFRPCAIIPGGGGRERRANDRWWPRSSWVET